MPERMDDRVENRDFEGTVSANEADTSGACGKLQKVQHACKDGGETVFTKVVGMVRFDRVGVEMKRVNANMWLRLI